MLTKEQADAIGTLSVFAFDHGEMAFHHLCAQAIAGEELAMARVEAALKKISAFTASGSTGNSVIDDLGNAGYTLKVIRETDTTRPDGGVARGGIKI